MNKCVLYICPNGRVDYIHDTFKNSDVYYVTYLKEDENALSFNKGANWIHNRDYLAQNVEKKYDYYIFMDYDVVFDIPNDKVEDLIDKHLEEYNPAIMTPVNKAKEKVVPGKITNNTQTNNHLKIVHKSLIDYFFPTINKFGGFWDGALFFNVLAIPFRENTIHVHDLPCHGTASANYAHNKNVSVGHKSLANMYEWLKPALGPKIPYKSFRDMDASENKHIGEIKKNSKDCSYTYDKEYVDISHKIFSYRK